MYCVTSDLKSLQKPTDDSAAIDALSGDFDTCAKAPATPQHSKVGHFLLITCKINSFLLLCESSSLSFAVALLRFRACLFGRCCPDVVVVLLL